MVSPSTIDRNTPHPSVIEDDVRALIARMTLDEKIGQMHQVDVSAGTLSDDLQADLAAGRIGSVLNISDWRFANEIQRLVIEKSRLGIPLLTARDVIHGYQTILPIPLGQAASWNPDLVKVGAQLAAREARHGGINWTFAPMIDISRDARWGRIAESFGEDPYLTKILGVAMTEGFQGDDLSDHNAIAACAKHFAGYGASESGRDYNTTNIPENELRNIYLPPFKALVDAGIATFMSSFSDLDGVPATANEFLMRSILRDEWGFDGLVVSDWDAVRQLSVHGLTDTDQEACFEALNAGIDMEMVGGAYSAHIKTLIADGRISEAMIDEMVANILRVKMRLGLFETAYIDEETLVTICDDGARDTARQAARESLVLLKNQKHVLPLEKTDQLKLAVIGPMAHEPYEQLGTWIFDGKPDLSVTPLDALRSTLSAERILFEPVMETTRDQELKGLERALTAAQQADAALLFLGEESILSGEAHSRADIDLPGRQNDLVKAVKETGTPVIAVILAGRPLTVAPMLDHCDAVLYAWHPGTMAGPAICDILFGEYSPSGKLPVSFPKAVGQIPIYYNHKNTGRPPTPNSTLHIDDIEKGATQTSFGMTAFHLDTGYQPLFPFGFGLSYTEFKYRDLELSTERLKEDQTLEVSVSLDNTGEREATETVQFYIRDQAASLTRPVRELKKFKRVTVRAGETQRVTFTLDASDLSFYRRDKSLGVERGYFSVWVGGDSACTLGAEFELV